jgi:small subunit ribosomal protein S3Ae|tara:strand:+ start:3227 stop:3829 length:603 start_codon:yes stop_codon:yes gene_type:complete
MAKKKEGKVKKEIKRKTNIVLKKKKKRWVSILAPKNFGEKELGESFIIDPQDLKGKRLKVSLSHLNKGKNPNIKAIFEVEKIVEGNGICEAVGYYILNSYSRRIVKKGKSKINRSLKLKTKDDVEVILKVVMITRKKVTRGLNRLITFELDKFLNDSVKKNSFESNLDSMINYSFQKSIKEHMKKVYPVAGLEITTFKKS